MATFTLTFSKLLDRHSTMPILNAQNETICALHKLERSTMGKILNAAMLIAAQISLPLHHETCTLQGKPLFRVHSTLFTKGVSHQLIMPDQSVIPIKRKTVQLLESSYSFTMDELVFRFEKDFTSTTYLYCNDKKIASAHYVENGIIREGIVYTLFESNDTLFVALLASLYHALFVGNN